MIKYIGDCPKTGDLTYLTNQGVLLLNSSLTVVNGKPGSHMKLWSDFTDFIISLEKVHFHIIYVQKQT